MEDNETSFLQNSSLESGQNDDQFPSTSGHENHKVIGDSGHVPKQIHQFYFVKLWPTAPDLVSKIRKLERVMEIITNDHLQNSQKITEKKSERDHLKNKLKYSDYYYYYGGFRSSKSSKGSILNDLYVTLDELCFSKNAPGRISTKSCFKGEFDNHKLNFMMLHGSNSLAEERKVLREISMSEQRDVAPFSSLNQLRNTMKENYYTNHCQKLLTEIEQYQLQKETEAGNAAVKGKISNYISLKEAVKEQIKHMRDETLAHRSERMAHSIEFKHIEKKLEAKNKELSSLQKKLAEKNQKKAKVYQSILDLKKVSDGKTTQYYQYRSLMNNVHQLAEKKDIAALDELSCSESSRFMLEWNNNRAFREDYEKRVVQSLERRQLTRDGRMISLK